MQLPTTKPFARAAALACLAPSALAQSASAGCDAPVPRTDAGSPFHNITAQLSGAKGIQRASNQIAANDEQLGHEDEQDDDNHEDQQGRNFVSVAPTARKAALRSILARRLRAARLLQGHDQIRAAQLLGYATSAQLSQWEAGRRQPPLEALVCAADLYGVTLDFLLGWSDEPDRDTHLALRAATFRGVRSMLEAASEGVIGLFERHAALLGPSAADVTAIVEAGQELQDAAAVVMRNPEWDELRGGARFVRCAHDFERVISTARTRLAAHREMGDQIQAQLKRAMAPAP